MFAVSTRPLSCPQWRAGALCSLGSVRRAWQAPKVDCYKLLGMSPSSSNAEIKEAFLVKAMQHHPDVNREQNKMVDLNLCYEALTKRRSEYDASRGVGGHSSRAAAYAEGRQAWWKKHTHGSPWDDLNDLDDLDAWEHELNKYRREGRTQNHNEKPRDKFTVRSWKQWADTWRSEHDATLKADTFRRPFGRRNRS